MSSVLSLQLKHSREWRRSTLIGFVDIKLGELLELCENNQPRLTASELASASGPDTYYRGVTLTLRDDHGQETGSLVVQLFSPAAQADNAVDNASHDFDGELPTSPPIPEPVRNVVDDDDVLNSLNQVVDKAKIAADLVSETAEVRVALPSQRNSHLLRSSY